MRPLAAPWVIRSRTEAAVAPRRRAPRRPRRARRRRDRFVAGRGAPPGRCTRRRRSRGRPRSPVSGWVGSKRLAGRARRPPARRRRAPGGRRRGRRPAGRRDHARWPRGQAWRASARLARTGRRRRPRSPTVGRNARVAAPIGQGGHTVAQHHVAHRHRVDVLVHGGGPDGALPRRRRCARRPQPGAARPRAVGDGRHPFEAASRRSERQVGGAGRRGRPGWPLQI